MPTTEADRDGGAVRTARLTLRPVKLSDAATIAGVSNDRAVLRNISFLPYPLSASDVERMIRRQSDSQDWLVAARSDDRQVVGVAGIHRDGDGGAEIGFWLGRAHWGRGYATEIACAIVAVAAGRGHDPLWALVLPDNAGSVRVLEKCGFVRDGEARRWYGLREAEMAVHRYRLAGDLR